MSNDSCECRFAVARDAHPHGRWKDAEMEGYVGSLQIPAMQKEHLNVNVVRTEVSYCLSKRPCSEPRGTGFKPSVQDCGDNIIRRKCVDWSW